MIRLSPPPPPAVTIPSREVGPPSVAAVPGRAREPLHGASRRMREAAGEAVATATGAGRVSKEGDAGLRDGGPPRLHVSEAGLRAGTPESQDGARSVAAEAEPSAEVEDLRARLGRMGALDKLKTDAMNLTTHELRSPLAIVYGYLSMMEGGMLGDLSPELTEAVAASIKSVEVMNQLVNELLEMARLDETHLSEMVSERVDVAEVAGAAAARVEGSERHHLRLDLDPGPAPVLGNRSQLFRVLANLVDNAMKYSPGGGEIRVSLRRGGGQVSVGITDHGLGIPADQIGRLFTRFGRIVTPSSQGIGGTGLGLYLCRETARRMGGDVTVVSVEGRGSTFTVRLPLAAGRDPSRRGGGS